MLSFQEYFVERKAEPVLRDIEYKGADKASPSKEVTYALLEADKIIIGPSNPILSIGPIVSIKKIIDADYPYKFLVVDTITALEEKCIPYAEILYSRKPMGKSWFKKDTNGKLDKAQKKYL